MRSFLIFGLAPALVVVVLLISGLLSRVRRIRRSWPRRIGAVLTSVLGTALVLPFACVSFARTDQGTWLCAICGRLEEQERYFGLVVSSTVPREPVRSIECAERYASWFQRTVALEHAHGWISIGCHGQGDRIACSRPVGLSLFHASLPLVPDEELARALVRNLARADPDRRRIMLQDFDRGWQGGPFAALVEGETPSREAFGAAQAAWIEAHPLWR